MAHAFTDLSRAEAEQAVVGLGGAAHHGRDAFRWVHARGAQRWEEMTTLSKGLRARLGAAMPLAHSRRDHEVVSPDGTCKLVLRVPGGALIETVWIPDGNRRTLCLSTQVGCAVGCRFCASGQGGLQRSLSPGEIVEQLLHARRATGDSRGPSHVVFMGIGEPLHNLEAVGRAIRILHDPHGAGISARRMTISTSGVLPRIDALAELGLPVNLAISLHAATPELRHALIPTQRGVSPRDLREAARGYRRKTGRDVTFEWTLLRGVNDTPEEARALARLLRGFPSTVNVIPFNPVEGTGFRRPETRRIRAFVEALTAAGIRVTVRRTRGETRDAACGQLRIRRESGAPPRIEHPAAGGSERAP